MIQHVGGLGTIPTLNAGDHATFDYEVDVFGANIVATVFGPAGASLQTIVQPDVGDGLRVQVKNIGSTTIQSGHRLRVTLIDED